MIKLFSDTSKLKYDNWPGDPATGILRAFAVDPKYQGKGYGKMLIEECIRRAKELKLSRLFLHTGHINEAAVHLFEKLGFKHLPQFDFFPYGQKETEAIAYCLEL